jgi:predicted phage baseplate assembly protein
MGVDVPELDDTDFEELLAEARNLLAAHSDEWTNYNPQDPGITILETLAWLTDSYLYQVDTVTDAHRRKYLQLMGERPRPPRPASTRLQLEGPEDALPLTVEAGTQLVVVDGSGTEKTFETDEAVVLSDAAVRAVVSQLGDGTREHSHANGTSGMFYRPLGGDPQPDDAVAFGLAGDPFADAETLSLTVDFRAADLPAAASHNDETPTFEPSVELVWEYLTDYESPDGNWQPLAVVRDETHRLYRSGTVRLAAPEEWTPEEWGANEHGLYDTDPGLVWLRCRVRRAGYEIPPRFNAIRARVVTATNRQTVRDEPLVRARGADGPASLSAQRFEFKHAPVVEADVTVDGEPWTAVTDFDASGPTDRHYVLEPSSGVVRFGDGVNGAQPAPDARVVAERYVAVDGAAGNVPGSAAWAFAEEATSAAGADLADIAVMPRRRATGGRDAETLETAFRRVRRDRKRPDRAVTGEDMAYLAEHTPGLRVGRTTVLLRERENGPRDAPPAADVVVVPYAPEGAGRPVPSEGFLDAVQEHVDRHRLLTDRVRVRPPTYVGVSLSLTVQSTDWRPVADRDDDIAAAVEAYLDPIHGYGGEGWPFGRTLQAAELADVVADVEWVDSVEELSVTARGNARVDADGTVRIDEASLFDLAAVEVDVEPGTSVDGEGGV